MHYSTEQNCTLIHPYLRHPRTGEPLRAVGVVAGRVLWPTLGASDDDASGNDDNGADNANDSGEQNANEDNSGASDSKIGDAWDGKIESLPADAQKLIDRYKNEAANASSKSRENARKEAEQELLKKLGLVKGDDKPDPDQLAKDLNDARSSQRQAAIELAVFRAAGKHQGDPDALLDSRGFLAKLADLDPTAAGFAGKVETAIKDAVKDNPKLKSDRASGASSVDHQAPAGEQRSNQPRSLADSVGGHYGT